MRWKKRRCNYDSTLRTNAKFWRINDWFEKRISIISGSISKRKSINALGYTG
jgi:hypothetical protein